MKVVYKTTNLINGKIYVGKQENYNKEYLGSGLVLSRAIKKYGKENFEKIILSECLTSKELNNKEIYWIEKLKATDNSIGYNITKGGTGGNTLSNHPDRENIIKQTNESKRNNPALRGKNHYLYGTSLSNVIKEKISVKIKEKYANGEIKRYRMTDDGRRRLSQYMKDNNYNNTPEGRARNSENNTGSKNPNANIYEFTSPDNKIFIIKGAIKKFCKLKKISYKKIIKIYNTNESVNGWKCNKISKVNTNKNI